MKSVTNCFLFVKLNKQPFFKLDWSVISNVVYYKVYTVFDCVYPVLSKMVEC